MHGDEDHITINKYSYIIKIIVDRGRGGANIYAAENRYLAFWPGDSYM